MSIPTSPQPVKLIVSILTGEQALVKVVGEKLKGRYGAFDFTSKAIPFRYTTYYEQEMGKNLFRHLASFDTLIAPDRLPAIKLYTNEVEQGLLRQDGTRRVNIDPGYIALSHLILATCKEFTHRPYLRDGVYADMTLVYQAKSFRSLPWTFPDYASSEMIELLNNIRASYYQQLQKK